MKQIREYLDAMSEARSLADINIAAGVALPVVSKIARRAVIILALTLLVTTLRSRAGIRVSTIGWSSPTGSTG